MLSPTEPKPAIFRQAALERVNSPEQLDQLMQVVTLRQWIPLGVLGGLVALTVAWSIIGRLPVTVAGRAALVDPKTALGGDSVVASVLAPSTGVVSEVTVRRGDQVHTGEVVAHMRQPDALASLEGERARLRDLEASQARLTPLQSERSGLSRQALEAEERQVRGTLSAARALTPVLDRRQSASIAAQRRAVERRLANARQLAASLGRTLATRQKLFDAGLIPNSLNFAAQRDYFAATEQVTDLEGQAADLGVKEAEAKKAYSDNLAEIARLQSQLAELALRGHTTLLDDKSRQVGESSQLADQRRVVQRLEQAYLLATEVHAHASGKVLEIAVTNSQAVAQGGKLLDIALPVISHQGGAQRLSAVGYFSVADGMRIKKGMKLLLTPDTVKREEFGGIAGTVVHVSDYPVSLAGVVNMVNSEALAQDLTQGGRWIEVFMSLEQAPGSFSGYRWSSSHGPHALLAIGTPGAAQVALQEKRPITFVLPFLERFDGAL